MDNLIPNPDQHLYAKKYIKLKTDTGNKITKFDIYTHTQEL
jgi:hypothetical protein